MNKNDKQVYTKSTEYTRQVWHNWRDNSSRQCLSKDIRKAWSNDSPSANKR